MFGDYIDIYDLTRAVDDGATVPVYFEPRLIKVGLRRSRPRRTSTPPPTRSTAGLDDAERARIEQSVAVINAVYGAPERLRCSAEDLVAHWESRAAEMRPLIDAPGKAHDRLRHPGDLRRLYERIIALRPDWHSDELDKGKIKVVYSGDATDTAPIKQARPPRSRRTRPSRSGCKDPDDELELVIVKDMMLTGYDSPPLHTLYLDRPLKGAAAHADPRPGQPHLPRQAGRAARRLRAAGRQPATRPSPSTPPATRTPSRWAATSTTRSRWSRTLLAVIGDEILRRYDWRAQRPGSAEVVLRTRSPAPSNYLRNPTTPATRSTRARRTWPSDSAGVRRSSPGCALARAPDALADFRDDVRSTKKSASTWPSSTPRSARPAARPSRRTSSCPAALAAERDRRRRGPRHLRRRRHRPARPVAAGRPVHRAEAQAAQPAPGHRGAAQAHRAGDAQGHPAQPRPAAGFLRAAHRADDKYTNQQLTSAEVIAELVGMAKEVAADANRGPFTRRSHDDELAFYDAVAQNESAVEREGEVCSPRSPATSSRHAARRPHRLDLPRRRPRQAPVVDQAAAGQHGYPPDAQPTAIQLVLGQMETFAEEWSPDASR